MPESAIEAVGVLHEPLRRAAYERAIASGGPVSRNDVADALGIGRTLAAHHLDRLAEAGLLEVSFARMTGRSGPGAGRPAKLYRRASTEHSLSLPPRDYRLLAEILADAVEAAGAEPALVSAAWRRGQAEAARLEAMEAIDPGAGGDAHDARVGKLRQMGYEPYIDGDVVRLRNCPFDGVARANPPVACGASLAFIEGLCGPGARLDPRRDGCCVVLAAADAASEHGTAGVAVEGGAAADAAVGHAAAGIAPTDGAVAGASAGVGTAASEIVGFRTAASKNNED